MTGLRALLFVFVAVPGLAWAQEGPPMVASGFLVGVPTGAQLFLSIHPKGLPSFRIAGGTLYYAHTWDVGTEVKMPYLRFLRLGVGYQGLHTSRAGENTLAELINEELLNLDIGFSPISPDQFSFNMSGFYIQAALQIKVVRVEFGLTQHQLRSLSNMIDRTFAHAWDEWAEKNLDEALHLGIDESTQNRRDLIQHNLELNHNNWFPNGTPFLRLGVEIPIR